MEDGKRESDVAQGASEQGTGSGGNPFSAEKLESTPDETEKTDQGKAKKDEDDETSALGEWLELITRAAFWALILYLFFFQVSVVDGPSMQPNFATNDRLVIDKLTYRFSAIRRFDVVVFQTVDMDQGTYENYEHLVWKDGWIQTKTERLRSRENKDYIKRVIGLPGDKVEMKGCNVWINGQPLNEPETITVGACYSPDPFIVPPRHYFVLGDNRGDSKDSRSSGLGFIPESQIRGIARLRFMPLGKWEWFRRQ